MLQLQIGHRVLHKATRLAGFVTSAPTATGWNRGLVTVTIEGSTRSEDWPLSQVFLRPELDQLPVHGGEFVPPKGFPLNTNASTD
jgi:hypothetical protein